MQGTVYSVMMHGDTTPINLNTVYEQGMINSCNSFPLWNLLTHFFFQGLDQQQSVQILQCYLQEDYRGTRNTLKVVLLQRSLALCVVILDSEKISDN